MYVAIVEMVFYSLFYHSRAFRMPEEIEKLKEYAKTKSDAKFVFKNNGHRGVK